MYLESISISPLIRDEMQEPRPLDFGCVILCPDRNTRTLLTTMRSIRNFSDAPCVAVVPKSTKRSITDDMKAICDVAFGHDTYTSLVNVGLGKTKKDWNFLIFAGSTVKPRFWARYTMFLEDEFDIMYPVSEGHYDFVEGSLNGLLLHINALKRAGRMPETSVLEQAKAVWAYAAIQKGHRLKGILGSRVVG